MARAARDIRESTQAIFRCFSVEKQELGLHWDEIKQNRYDGTLTDEGLEIFANMDTCCADYCLNLVASTTINQKLPIRTGRAPPDSDGQRQQPVDPWHPPMVAIGENSLDGYNAVSYQSWLGPEDMRLREEPSKQQKQVLLDFATVVCFDKSASEAQVPASIPEPYRTPCIDAVRSCNPRLKHSQQECYENTGMERSINQKLAINLVDLIAMLCFVHYRIGETGRNKWLWKKLKAARILKCCQYDFDWGNVVDGIIHDDEGRSLAKKITTEEPQPRSRRVNRTQIGAKRDRAKFQRRILHVYQGTNEDGVAVYKTYHDKFLANQAALDQLHQDQLIVGTELDLEEREARARVGQRHPVPHHYLDEKDRP